MAYQSKFTGPQIDSVINACLTFDSDGNNNLYYLSKLKSQLATIQSHDDRLKAFDDGTYVPDNLATAINAKLPLAGGQMSGQIYYPVTNCELEEIGDKAFIKMLKPTTTAYAPLCAYKVDDNKYFSMGLNGNGDFIWRHPDNDDEFSACITSQGQVLGAVWNDFAEYRASNEICAGRVVCECGNGFMTRSTKRLQPGAEIVSDTFGFAIGETKSCQTPIAVAGRVLAYPYEKRNSYKPGDPVCSGPNGTVSKMSRREVRKYPDRMIGTVSEIPDYETWGKNEIPVNGRIWIRIK